MNCHLSGEAGYGHNTVTEANSPHTMVALSLLAAANRRRPQRSNIIYIMSDDHDDDAISAYNPVSFPPYRPFGQEALFTQAFVGNSILFPAWATLLTGQHSHKNRVKDNALRLFAFRGRLPDGDHRNGTCLPAGFDFWKILPTRGLYYSPDDHHAGRYHHGSGLCRNPDHAMRSTGWITGILPNPLTYPVSPQSASPPVCTALKWLEKFRRTPVSRTGNTLPRYRQARRHLAHPNRASVSVMRLSPT